jgi:hypothetical protein
VPAFTAQKAGTELASARPYTELEDGSSAATAKENLVDIRCVLSGGVISRARVRPPSRVKASSGETHCADDGTREFCFTHRPLVSVVCIEIHPPSHSTSQYRVFQPVRSPSLFNTIDANRYVSTIPPIYERDRRASSIGYAERAERPSQLLGIVVSHLKHGPRRVERLAVASGVGSQVGGGTG